MRRVAVVAVLALACAGAAAGSPPPTARCHDGTVSYAQHHSGACSHHGGVAVWLDAKKAAPLHLAVSATHLLAARTRTSGCAHGVLPDRRCSPGAVDRTLTQARICSAGFRTGSVRNVPQSEKFAVEREDGMPAKLYGRTIEIDHIVPLELGGSNSIANLFPEPGSGADSYHVKDELENRVHALVCSGRLALRTAQQRIATNWQRFYTSVFG